MNIVEAKKNVIFLRIVAGLMFVVALLFFVCGMLKGLSSTGADGNDELSALLNQPIQNFVFFVRTHTQYISWIWYLAPELNLKKFNSAENFVLASFFFFALLGRVIWDSASRKSSHISATIQAAESLRWQQQLLAQPALTQSVTPDISQLNIEFDQKEHWYKRPVGYISMTAIAAVLAQWINLKLGLIH